jgi:site-specific DNA-methyltransferase (adenine-specific)
MFVATETTVRLGDCLDLMREMPAGSIDLAYVDPPFFTQKVHQLHTRDRTRSFSFADIWRSHEEYANFLGDRMQEVHRILSENGSLFFHCDRSANHIVRLLLDDVFGSENFRAEIIWHYRRWSNSRRGLLPAHQTILYYSKSENFTFHTVMGEYSPSTNVDQLLQRRTRDEFNKSIYDRDDKGNVIPSGRKAGVPMSDVWDIPFLNPKAKERSGYPTQKPVLLLERIIQLSTNAGDTVLDPFCGSGTTLVAAALLNRRAIGIDVSNDAVEMTKQRLMNPQRTDSALLAAGRETYRNADEAALSLLVGLDYVPVQRNSGIDALLRQDLEGTPIPIRIQRQHETIGEAAQKLFYASESKGARIMFLVVVARGGEFSFGEELPDGVVTIESPVAGIRNHLTMLKKNRTSLILK